MPQTFNPLTAPLIGTQLIEASAGTGKTYNIAALFTRLIVLENYSPDQILVMTFTDAATAELKTRLRARLAQTLSYLEAERTPSAEDDPFLAQLLALIAKRASDERASIIMRLKAALSSFDTAAIYTIHGFCRKVLADFAFFCHTPFQIDLDNEAAQADMVAAINDYWRQSIAPNPEYAALALAYEFSPEKLLHNKTWCDALKKPDIQIRLPEKSVHDWAKHEKIIHTLWQSVAAQSAEIANTLSRLFDKKVIKGNKIQEITRKKLFTLLANAPAMCPDDISIISKFPLNRDTLTEYEQGYLNKNKTASEDEIAILAPLANLAAALNEAAEIENSAIIRLQLECLSHVRQTISQATPKPTLGYDELLNRVYQALKIGEHRHALASALAQKWRIALIDEFQDTDPQQYAIFQIAFIQQNIPVFLVGDPKQAIYAFRGADIQAYLQAAEEADCQYTLATNFRSNEALVKGIGQLFSRAAPFILPIEYESIAAKRSQSKLQPHQPAIAIRWLHEHEEEKLNKDILRERAAEYCANEIAALLNQASERQLLLGEEVLRPKDIAILVRTNKEAEQLKDALKQHRIQSASNQKGSVFQSPEAKAILLLLHYWREPSQSAKLRFVLASRLFGYSAKQIHALNQNTTELSQWQSLAQECHQLWQSRKLYSAFSYFAQQTGMEAQLIYEEAERSLTNYWHIAHLLAKTQQQHPSTEALLIWYEQEISREQNIDESELWLESDEDLIQIVTMHSAKGLEYPIVFCPFVWDKRGEPNTPNAEKWYLSPSDGQNLLLNKLQISESENSALEANELAENLRLFYVAATRAKETLILYTAASNDLAQSPLGYLLAPEVSADKLAHFWQNEPQAKLKQAWLAMMEQQSASFTWLDNAPASTQYQPQRVQSEHYQAEAITLPPQSLRTTPHTSFTALSRTISLQEDWLITDTTLDIEHETAPANNNSICHEPESALLAFPRGAHAGTCLHSILEQTHFRQPNNNKHRAILEAYQFDPDIWLDATNEMVEAVRHAPLNAKGSHLATIPERQCKAEMGFVLSIADFSPQRLQQWFTKTQHQLPPALAQSATHQLSFNIIQGYLNGFIDLICSDDSQQVYIIDYKSNHLGNQYADYQTAALENSMREHHYVLQALIYAIATARYLKERQALPPTLAIRYLYLRGLNPHGKEGIWSWDLPTSALSEWLKPHR